MADSSPGVFPASPGALPGPYSSARGLPNGTWNVIANGRVYTLQISGSGAQVAAQLSSGDVKDIRWNQATGTLSFVRVLPHIQQRFTGYLFDSDGKDSKWRLAGSFADVKGGRPYGFYATLKK